MSEKGTVSKSEKNPRGIPHAPFIADVEAHIGGPDAEVEPVLARFEEALAKYRYMEANLAQRKAAVEAKIPDIRKTLTMVEFLKEQREGKKTRPDDDDDDLELDEDDSSSSSRKPIRTTFELNDTLYAEAELEDSDTVYLWLGADVMLSYKIPEAIELLQSKLKVAEENLANYTSDLEYLKEQTTIMEVNMALPTAPLARDVRYPCRAVLHGHRTSRSRSSAMAFSTNTLIISANGDDDDGNTNKSIQKNIGGSDDSDGVTGRCQPGVTVDAAAGAVADSKSIDGSFDSLSDEFKFDLYRRSDIDPVYHAKSHLINEAFKEIGMGKYQWGLFIAAGFGWFADSVWPQTAGLILSPVVNELQFKTPFLSLAFNVGQFVGAAFWGLGCDIIGRRWSFNITLFLSGVFGLGAGGSHSFITLASLFAVIGVGVGGNMPVDSAVFLEFIPASRQYLLTVLSIWWCIGYLIAALIAWPLIANFSCPVADAAEDGCPESANRGWRYLLFTVGGLMLALWCLRALVFRLYESPRYLIARGEDEKAVAVLHAVARINGTTCSLTAEQLKRAGASAVASYGVSPLIVSVNEYHKPGLCGVAKRSVREILVHVKGLFATRKVAWSTSLLIFLWGIISLASTLYNSFLPYLLASKGATFGDASLTITYRNTVILAAVGIPGAFLAGWAVDLPVIGRRGTLMVSCAATAVFLFATTTARTSDALLGWNCGYTFFSNIMYGVLYAVSPEIFPAKDRGTGNGLVAIAARVFSVIAPIIALYADLTTSVPVYISGGLIILAGFVALLLPFEPQGKASL
ncbi:MFS1_2 [Sanghuangporus sanghuang]